MVFMISKDRRHIQKTNALLLLGRTESKGPEIGHLLEAKSCLCKQEEETHIALLPDLKELDAVACLLFVAIIEKRGQAELHAF